MFTVLYGGKRGKQFHQIKIILFFASKANDRCYSQLKCVLHVEREKRDFLSNGQSYILQPGNLSFRCPHKKKPRQSPEAKPQQGWHWAQCNCLNSVQHFFRTLKTVDRPKQSWPLIVCSWFKMSCAELSKLCFVAVFVNVQAHSSHTNFYGKCIAGVTQLSSTFTVRWDIWQTSRKRGESKCNTVVLAAPQVSLVLSHATGQMWPTAARVEKNNKPMCARPSSWDVAPLLLQKRRKRERRQVVMKMLP